MKTLYALALALATGAAFGATTTFTDLSTNVTQNNLTWDASTGTLTQAGVTTDNNLFSPTGGTSKTYPEISLSFTLNLTKLGTTSGQVDLVRVNLDSNDVGILWTGAGIKGIWGDSGSHGDVTSLDTLLANTNVFTVGDSKYLTVTMTSAQNGNTNTHGVQVYDISGNRVFSSNSLGAGGTAGKSVSDVTLNTDVVNMFSVTNSWLSANDAKAQAVSLNTDSQAALEAAAAANQGSGSSTGNIPEPATATLSLLALAGLAARRRRK